MNQTQRQPAANPAESRPSESATLETVLTETANRQQSIRHTAAMFLGVPPAKVCELLRNVWRTSNGQPPLTDAEMFMGMSLIARYALDPIAREVYVTRDGKGRLMTIIGIDGWVKVLDKTEGYDGFEQELGWEGKDLNWVETRIYSTKRSKPTVYRAFAEEYAKLGGFVAKSLPWHMLRLFSLRHAARLFTPIGGSVVTEEEARWMTAYADASEAEPPRKTTLDDLARRPAPETETPPEQGPSEDELTLSDYRESIANAPERADVESFVAMAEREHPHLIEAVRAMARERIKQIP